MTKTHDNCAVRLQRWAQEAVAQAAGLPDATYNALYPRYTTRAVHNTTQKAAHNTTRKAVHYTTRKAAR